MSDAGVSLDLLRQSLAASVAALAVWREVRDVSGQLVDLEAVDASVGFGAWVGLPPDEVVGRRYSEMIPSGIHSRLPLYLKAMETGDAVTVAFDRVLPDGTEASSEIRAVPFGDGEMFVAMWDVTDTRRQLAETERAHAEALLTRDLLTAALNSSPDAFAIYRVARGEAGAVEAITVEFVNEAAATTTGRTPEAWVGADVRERLSDEGSGGLYEHLVAAVDELVPRRVTISLRMPSGWMGVFDHVISPFGVDRVITNWRPVDRRAGAASATVRAAPGTRTDPLTGLINRGEFRRRLAQWVRDRGPADAAGAVLVVDLDEFGRLNDIVGTHRADAALATLGAELRALDPWLQLPARIGSDEFAGVLVGPLDAAAVDVARSRLHHVLTRTATLHELPPLSISAGLRVIEPGASVDQLIRDANTALRHATRAGGGTVTVFTEQVRRSLLIDYLEGDDIRRGMVAGEFALALQPIVDIASGSPVGDEALIRWLHSELGLLLPSHFISVAESTDVIVDLGGWVIGEAVARLSTTVGDR